MKCEICKQNDSYIYTFMGPICHECDSKTDRMAEAKRKEWSLPRFENDDWDDLKADDDARRYLDIELSNRTYY